MVIFSKSIQAMGRKERLAKWAEIKVDSTTHRAFYDKMLDDIENNEKKKSNALEKPNHHAIVEFHSRKGNNIPVYDTQSAQWMKLV